MAGKKKVSLPVVEYDEAVVAPDTQGHTKTPVCTGCEFEHKLRMPGMGATGEVDIMFVSESPSSWSVNNKQIFYGRGGRIIRNAWKTLREMDEKTGHHLGIRHLRKWDTYAVQCQVEEGRDQSATTPKAVIDRCSIYLHSAVKNKKPKIILAFGSNALKALGYKGDKFMEVRGRLLDMVVAGHTVKVLPTFSTKHLMAKTGLYNLFWNDFVRACRIASGVDSALSQVSIEEITKEYSFPKTVAEVGALCDEIINYVVPGAAHAAQCALAVDTETNTVNPHRKDAKVLCVSFSWDVGKSTAIPLFHKEASWTPEELEQVIAHIRRVLECAKPKVFHNAKFDLKFLELCHGFKVFNVAWDTMLGEHLLREDMAGSYSLKVLGRSYFPAFANYADKVHEIASTLTVEEEAIHAALDGVKKGKVKKNTPGFDPGMALEWSKGEVETYLFGSKKDRKKKTLDSGYERVPIETLLIYAAIDTDLTRRLLRNQFARMKEEGFNAKALMNSHSVPASRVLGKMEFTGMRVNRAYLAQVKADLEQIVTAKGRELRSFWGESTEFNPNSTAHVGTVLYQKGILNPKTGKPETRLGPWVERNQKSQQWKTDKKTLRAIVEKMKCPFTTALLEYRAAHKANSGFVHEIDLLSEYDNYLHTSFHLHGTSTGRLSSSNLNMQNIPKFIAGVNFKKIFVPDEEDEVIVNLDYKGAEIRVFTAYAPDAKLIQALIDGLDVHSFFAQEIYGTPYEEMMARESIKDTNRERYLFLDQQRTNCKRVVFGILYGAMARKIAETAGISESEAQLVIDKLFERFPSLKDYMDATVAQIHKLGYVETLFGRRRRFPLQNVNGFFRGQAERRGKNMKIQSTSSDIVLGQLIELDEHIQEVGGRVCITVHDSIVASVKKKYVHQLPAFLNHYCVKRVAEKYPWLPVPFTCDIEVGPSYGEAMNIEKYLKQEKANLPSPEEALLIELDEEAMDEIREDEEEAKEREAVAHVGGGS